MPNVCCANKKQSSILEDKMALDHNDSYLIPSIGSKKVTQGLASFLNRGSNLSWISELNMTKYTFDITFDF